MSGRRFDSEVQTDFVQQQLEKILSNGRFRNSERLSRFLRFTVEETAAGRSDQLKEYFIGTEVFDRGASYDPRSDPIVRVEAGRLRTKLASYYEADGRADSVIIEFPKGSYVPVFHWRDSLKLGETRLSTWSRWLAQSSTIVLILAMLTTLLAVVWGVSLSQRAGSLERELTALKRQLPENEFGPIWKTFFSPGATVAVFGSPIFLTNERYGLFLRIPDVNEASDLQTRREFLALNERIGPLLGPRYDYATMADAQAIQKLTGFFAAGGRILNALPAHLTVWESIKDHNIIFIGAPRMNPLLQRLPVRQDFVIGPPDNSIYNRNPQPGEEKVYTTPSHRDAVTYAVIASFPGLRPDREIMTITAPAGSGILAAVDYVTRAATAREMIERLRLSGSRGRRYYQLLLRVNADRDAPVKTEYVTHHLIETAASKP
jgi:hypothetical protein